MTGGQHDTTKAVRKLKWEVNELRSEQARTNELLEEIRDELRG